MITAAERRRGMDYSIYSAVLSSFFLAAVGGPVLTGLMLSLHFTKFQIGLVTAVGLLFPPLQVAGALWQSHRCRRKTFWGFWNGVYYAAYLLLAGLTLGWTTLPGGTGIGYFLLLFGLIQLAAQLPAAVFLAWLGDLTPAAESNAFWNRRQAWMQIAAIVAAIGVGFTVDLLGRDRTLTYTVMLVAGTLFGWWAFRVQARVPDPETARPAGHAPGIQLRHTWHNRNFRLLLAFFSVQSFAISMVSGFFFVYLQQNLKLSMTAIQTLTAISGLVGFFSAMWFKNLGNRIGRKKLLLWCSGFKVVELLCWGTLSAGGGWLQALPCFIIGGAVNTGIAAMQLSLLTSLNRSRNKSFAIALFAALVGLCGLVSAGCSGRIYDRLETVWHVSATLTPFNLLCLTSAALYLVGLFWLRSFREPQLPPPEAVRTQPTK